MSEENKKIGKSVTSKSFDNNKSEVALREEKILDFWKQNKIFKKSLDKDASSGDFVFYEGPPTANGKPGIHHLEARSFKDAVPRYKTMRGYSVRRKGGWDTHGLPVELLVEKNLKLSSKHEIEDYGVGKFNKECKKSVWEYVDLWEKFTDRIGYWVDQENPYVTYDNKYIESVWSVLAEVEKKGLLYKDYKVVPWCARCGTALSSHEVSQGYKDVQDLSLYVKFKLKEEENTYILAWTTTPWTLPGNVALAVGEDIDYVKVAKDGEFYILAKEKLSLVEGAEVVEELKGSDLVELEYEPLFSYLENTILEEQKNNLTNAFKIYPADFVTTEDGTGVVHTAVMYGQDDFDLGTKVGLPKHHLVTPEGEFIEGTDFLSGRFVKEKKDGKPSLDIDIIKYLQENNLYFNKEKYTHSYPHCWRCKTPLLYYARDSWYIRMSDPSIKEKMIEENKGINWEPSHIKDGRFGEWLREIKDWAISRERYWGTPLPVWVSDDGDRLVVDSLDTLKKYTKNSGNKYFVMRHGGSEGNKTNLVSYGNQENDHLTEEGKKGVEASAYEMKGEGIDLIITSNFARTKETAEIVREVLGLPAESIVEDERLKEIDPGRFDGGKWADYHEHVVKVGPDWFDQKIEDGESLADVKRRTGEALYSLEEKYKNRNILLITHGGPAWLLFVNTGLFEPDGEEFFPENTHVFVEDFKKFENAEMRPLLFTPLPSDENYNLDLHRPYIDDVVLVKDGKEFKRTKEVMDVWFDSGAMPFAQDHYPFENKEKIDSFGYPADFISEAIDQTRGWFYTLHAVGALMGKGKAYRNVICLGHLLDKEGKKMSKSLGNIVDPWEMMDKYGVDTLRLWMYSVNQPGESKSFDEKTVIDLQRQVFGLLYNVLAFYELYRDKSLENLPLARSENVLDQWILVRLSQFVESTTKYMDNYKLLEPVRGLREFIGDLSTWYVRRSRERLKEGGKEVKQTLYYVLKTLSKLMAPFTPFAAEDIWQKLKLDNDKESVHLCDWPEVSGFSVGKPEELVAEMKEVREVVSLGLKERQKAGIRVRQPLLKATVFGKKLPKTYENIIKDELNVRAVEYKKKEEGEELEILLDKNITPELKEEGYYRELVRGLQSIRKKMDLLPRDLVTLTMDAGSAEKDLIEKFKEDLLKTVSVKEVVFAKNEGEEIKVSDLVFVVSLRR